MLLAGKTESKKENKHRNRTHTQKKKKGKTNIKTHDNDIQIVDSLSQLFCIPCQIINFRFQLNFCSCNPEGIICIPIYFVF